MKNKNKVVFQFEYCEMSDKVCGFVQVACYFVYILVCYLCLFYRLL